METEDLTIQNIESKFEKFDIKLRLTLETLIEFSISKSPLSDLNFISSKLQTKLDGINVPNINTWIPVRNVLRLVAKMADDELNDSEVIAEINIEDMVCGCDYFEGVSYYVTSNGSKRGGKFKWKWTAFPGYDKHYNKFVVYSNP